MDEMDWYTEDEDFVAYESLTKKYQAEIIKIGKPWNRSIQTSEQARKAGEDARRLEVLREALERIKSDNS